MVRFSLMKKDSQIRIDYGTWIERLKSAGFSAADRGDGRTLITKDGCGAVLERSENGTPKFAVRPGLIWGQGIARLLDRGYQKFWQEGDRTFPAIAEQLKALHRFERDLRSVMSLSNLYNESLGTVSSRYVYDRVEGREEPKRHQQF